MEMISIDPVEIGARIRAARSYAGMSQEELGVDLEASRRTVVEWEKGERLPAGKRLEWLLREVSLATGWPHALLTKDLDVFRAPAEREESAAA